MSEIDKGRTIGEMLHPDKYLNDKPFQHTAQHGTEIFAERCDFRGNVALKVPLRLSKDQLASDVAEIIGFHAINIYPKLSSFAGYDCIKFQLAETTVIRCSK